MSKPSDTNRRSPWPHRVAWLVAGLSFPLIWVGGLVTTFDAGMAVPDWPNTYNYNMFAYPVRDWFFGPWDLFVEHGHRLLGSLVGLVCIGLVICTWVVERRGWVRWLSVVILLMVIAQGVLGGGRVVQNDRLLAMIHGCFGPLFFATVVAMIVFTSRWWTADRLPINRSLYSAIWMRRVAIALPIVSYGQLVLGASLRHIPVDAQPTTYQTLILWHVAVALLVVALGLQGAYFSSRKNLRGSGMQWPALCTAGLVLVQVGLGVTTYVVKYGWPAWFRGWAVAERFIVAEKSFWQMNLITMHQAVGSLILAVTTVMAVRICRLWLGAEQTLESPSADRRVPTMASAT